MQPNGYKGHSWCSWALAMGKLRQGGAQCPALAPALSLATATAPGGAQDTPPDHRVLPELRVSSETGAVFVHELKRELFLEAFVTRSEDDGATPITFHAHLRDHPDLPLWLRYTQRDPHQPGYLYGCPTATEVGPHTIEVLAYNRLTYETAAQSLLITIIPAPRGHPPFQGEFLVGNRNVEELLPVAARDMFLQATEGVWEQGDLQVINVTSALDRGGRVPLPIEGRREGVYVSVGSHGPFSGCLTSASSSRSRFLCSLGQQPLASCYDTFAPHFSIQWCNLTLLQVQPSPTEPGPVWGSGVLEEGGGFQPPTEEPPPDLLPQFLLTLLVPLVVAALLCLFLGHLMCCRREGVQKRDLETSDIQLFHHTTIHGDTQELRLMAGSRDVPQPLSTLPMFNVRTGQRINPMAAAADGARVPLLPQ
ncbi:alpha-sarcoglycan [Melopsittacus undulatus]|nr:alpha-sarcoglycan [Melopsittacus undulatus]